MLERVVQESGCDQSCWVSHIYHEDRTYLIRYPTDTRVVPLAAIGTRAGDNKFRFVRARLELQVVVIDASRLFLEVVAYGVEHQTAEVNG